MKPTIEPGIPLPDRYAPKRNGWVREMQPGDSVLVDTFAQAKSIAARLVRVGYKSATRKQRDGWRVWRLPE